MTDLITSLFSKVAEDLWGLQRPGPGKKGLVFPVNDGGLAVTEQPASHLFGHHAANSPTISYAPEAPTKHLFYGKRKRSALFDWRLFDAATGKGLANIEFKSRTGGDVASDMRKLVKDELEGAWFCTLRAATKQLSTEFSRDCARPSKRCCLLAATVMT